MILPQLGELWTRDACDDGTSLPSRLPSTHPPRNYRSPPRPSATPPACPMSRPPARPPGRPAGYPPVHAVCPSALLFGPPLLAISHAILVGLSVTPSAPVFTRSPLCPSAWPPVRSAVHTIRPPVRPPRRSPAPLARPSARRCLPRPSASSSAHLSICLARPSASPATRLPCPTMCPTTHVAVAAVVRG